MISRRSLLGSTVAVAATAALPKIPTTPGTTVFLTCASTFDQPATIYVDFSYCGYEDGTITRPFRTIATAMRFVGRDYRDGWVTIQLSPGKMRIRT